MAKSKDQINYKKVNKISYSDIVKDTNPILREISNDVLYPLGKDDKMILHSMIEYVRSSQDPEEAARRKLRPAYGISAIQLGHTKKLIYIRIQNEFSQKAEEFALVNPRIVHEDTQRAYLPTGEGCLSVDDNREGYVMRSNHIKIRAIDFFTDREVEIDAKGLTAIVLQHEMDHLSGILFYDRINTLNPYNIPANAIEIKH